jgi:amidophosphoribosyltransferase
MCGIVGALSKSSVNQLLYDALLLLQHRGQDAAGIVTMQGTKCFMRGMVRDVFRTRNMRALPGNVGLGQVRYPTAGNAWSEEEAQPFYVNAPYGIVLVHNGNLTNARALKSELFRIDRRHINTESDTEVLINILAHEIEVAAQDRPMTPQVAFDAVAAVHKRLKGSYAVIALIAGHGLLAFRDPNGIRPLAYGELRDDGAVEYMVASESVAIEGTGRKVVRDVAPGEAIFVDLEGRLHTRQCAEHPALHPCMFEFVYLARPDSVLDGISVYQARLNLGETLAQRVISTMPPSEIDVVIPIPESSRPSAMQLAHKLGKPYREGFVKNRYVGRTFIMPGQAVRKKSVRQKLNAIGVEFKGRNVLLVDDSIVRGTTSKEIVQMAREAGARKVFMASAAPPVRHPNVYGIDMPTRDELIAAERSIEQIREYIGADALIYQDVDAMKRVVGALNPRIDGFEASCFDGRYVTGDISAEDFAAIEAQRTAARGDDEDSAGERTRLALQNADSD